MQDNNHFTVIVAHQRGARISKFRVPRHLSKFILATLLILIASSVALLFHFGNTAAQRRELRRLQAEYSELKKENESIRLSATQISEKVASLEVISKKLRLMSGMDRDEGGFGGVGGFGAKGLGRTSAAELVGRINRLDRKAIELESQFEELKAYYDLRNLVLAATPSLAPVRGYPSAGFGYRFDPFTGVRDFHSGLDISAPYGNKVVAAADGVVVFAGYRPDYGNLVVIDHKFGFSTRYGHLAYARVVPGQRIERGATVGFVGSSGRSTGPHLHYEVRVNEQALNPYKFLSAARQHLAD